MLYKDSRRKSCSANVFHLKDRSFISVEPLCFLCAVAGTAQCHAHLAPGPSQLGIYPVSLHTVQQMSSPGIQPEFRVCLRSSSAASGRGADCGCWSWGALSPCPVQLLSVSLPPAGSPEALAADKRKGPQRLWFEKERLWGHVETSLHSFITEAAFKRSYFGIFHSISHLFSSTGLQVKLVQ